MSETQKPLNVQQAAEFLGLKVSYIYNLVYSKKLVAFKPGGKRLVFRIADLEKYAYSNGVGSHADRADAILSKAQKPRPRKRAKSGGAS